MDQSGPNWTYVNQIDRIEKNGLNWTEMDRSELRVLELGIVNPPPPPMVNLQHLNLKSVHYPKL